MRRVLPLTVVLAVLAQPAYASAPLKSDYRFAAAARSASPQTLAAHPWSLLSVAHAHSGRAAPVLLRNGGVLLSRDIGLWRVPSAAAVRLLPRLERRGWVRLAAPDVRLAPAGHLVPPDPLVPLEGWLRAGGADRAQPPGPGRPRPVLDTGLDLSHPEFAGRPDTIPLNIQTFNDEDSGVHGTAVSSMVGAPVNGKGLVGVYPRALLQSFDGYNLDFGPVMAGLSQASRRSTGVINLSLGYPVAAFHPSLSRVIFEAITAAQRRGSLVVAAAGNGRGDGSPAVFPAALPHVLTVAATDDASVVTDFSTASPAVDLAAPGDQVPLAVPVWVQPEGYRFGSGTSFSAPIVSGAAAWVWTARPELDATQVHEILRRSARDIAAPGFDDDSGFGILDIPSALAAPAPARDPLEPNEDVDLLRPNRVFREGSTALTRPGRRQATLAARLEISEDPEDVYRVWVPPGRSVVARVVANADVELELWGPFTVSVHDRGAARARNLKASSARFGMQPEVARFPNRNSHGVYAFVDVFLPREVARAGYTVNVKTVRP